MTIESTFGLFNNDTEICEAFTPLPLLCFTDLHKITRDPFNFITIPPGTSTLIDRKFQLHPLDRTQWERGMITGNFGRPDYLTAAYFVWPESILILKPKNYGQVIINGRTPLESRTYLHFMENTPLAFFAGIFNNGQEINDLLASTYDLQISSTWPSDPKIDCGEKIVPQL